MATGNDLIEAALRDIGVLAAGEDASYEDASDALEALNRLKGQWNLEPLRLYTITRTTWTITASDGTYTVGSGGDINITRPSDLERVNYIDTSATPDIEISLNPLTEDAYAQISEKADTSTYPSSWYYNPTYSSGLATLNLFPIPTSSDLEGAMYYRERFSAFTLAGTVSLPDGYEQMIVKELALELSPSYGVQPSPLLLQQARDARTLVKRANTRMLDLSLDQGALVQGRTGGGYSILTG